MAIFAPINIISGYSFLQSGLTINKIAQSVKANEYFGFGIADNGVMHGVPNLIKSAEALNKPYIVGVRFKILDYSLVLYCLDEDGYRNLISLSNNLQKGTISFEMLKLKSKGLACVLETKYEKFFTISNLLVTDEHLRKEINEFASLFENFFLGIEVTSKEEVAYANLIRNFAHEYTYNCIAFPRIRYQKKDDAIVIKIVNAIANDEELEETNAVGQEYFMIEKDYQKIYTQKELLNTIELIKKSNFNFGQKRGKMLVYSNDADGLLKEKCYKKLLELHIDDSIHKDRLDYELSVIKEMGYPNYFLLVEDYVNYSKNNGILVGAGRGSAAGSLVAYLLNITEVDPLDYNLQFERFLNPYRKTMPDIDVDFMDIKRDDVVQYMREKFGQNKVSNIVTYQTFQAKQSIRDIGRVYKFEEAHIDLLCKRLTNNKLSLRESYKQLQEFKSLVDSDKYYLKIITLASKIEGLPRQTGLHAAGIILNEEPLDEILPITYDFQGNIISQYEMGFLEEQGLLKMDFLGLRNLTTVYYALELIKQNHNKEISFDEIPYISEEAIKLIADGYTMGVFQLESSGMKRAIKILQPSCFEDIVALLALFRPGPMDSISSYARRKQNKETIYYFSDSLKPVLEPTYGIIVYQEQINQIAQIMAGFTMGEADMFRRAVSKKKKEELVKLKESFIKGSIENGYTNKTATEVYDLIFKFADYGFNKSHSVVYSILATRMAYIKHFYPLEFYASILETSCSTNDTKFNLYVSEMKHRGYKMLPPNINESSNKFEIKGDALLFPLNKIHGVNDLLTSKILEERANNQFSDFFNFVYRMKKYGITDNQIICLINSGSLDIFSDSRQSLRDSIKLANQYAKMVLNDNGQMSLDGVVSVEYPNLIKTRDDPLENLNLEFQAIDIMLSNNPLHYKKDLLKANNVIDITSAEINVLCNICGIIRDVKTIRTKDNQTMAFLKIFDETGEIECTVTPLTYQKTVNYISKNKIIVITGRLRERFEEISFLADNIKPLEEEENYA